MEKYALSIGMKGLGYISVNADMTYKGPIDKFMTDEQKRKSLRLQISSLRTFSISSATSRIR